MSELAYDTNGDRFEVPAQVTGWRVRRFRNVGARGAPEVVFGEDGRPLVLPVEASIEDFRAQVEAAPGRYRLDPVDGNGRGVDKLPAAYLQLGDGNRAAAASGGSSPPISSDAMLGEVVRANAEMVKVIAEKFSGVMEAAATLLKAADGAGLPARTPVELPRNGAAEDAGADDDEEEEDDDEEDEREPGIGDFLAQIMPLVQMVMSRQLGKAPGARRNTGAPGTAKRADNPPAETPAAETGPKAEAKAASPRPITPEMLMHFQAIQSALSEEEAAFAREVAAELSAEEVQQWMAELTAMSVDDAVARIRAHIAGQEQAS